MWGYPYLWGWTPQGASCFGSTRRGRDRFRARRGVGARSSKQVVGRRHVVTAHTCGTVTGNDGSVFVDREPRPSASALLEHGPTQKSAGGRLMPRHDSRAFGHRRLGRERSVGFEGAGNSRIDAHAKQRAVAAMAEGSRNWSRFGPTASCGKIGPARSRRRRSRRRLGFRNGVGDTDERLRCRRCAPNLERQHRADQQAAPTTERHESSVQQAGMVPRSEWVPCPPRVDGAFVDSASAALPALGASHLRADSARSRRLRRSSSRRPEQRRPRARSRVSTSGDHDGGDARAVALARASARQERPWLVGGRARQA